MNRSTLRWNKSCKINVLRKIGIYIDFMREGVSYCMLNDTLKVKLQQLQ